MTPQLLQRLAQALTGLRFGAVQLVVHEGHVVRIERIERLRLTDTPEAETTTLAHPTGSPEASRPSTREVRCTESGAG